MVTGSIKTAGYEFFTANTDAKTQNKNQTDFSDAIGKAQENQNSTVKDTSKAEDRNHIQKEETKTEKLSSDETDESQDKEVQDVEKTEEPEENVSTVENEAGEPQEETDFIKAAENLVDFQIQPETEPVAEDGSLQQIFDKMTEELQVTAEDLQAVMDQLNMDISDLQEPQNLLKVIVEVKQLKGPEELLTNQQLADTFKNLSAEIKEMFSEQPEGENQQENVSPVKQETVYVKSDASQTMAQENSQDESPYSSQENQQTQSVQADPAVNAAVQRTEGIYDKVQELLAERVDADVSESIIRQVVDQIKWNIKTDVTSMQMQLYPEHLGKVAIQVVSRNGVLTAQIAAENEAAKTALESQLGILKESFENQGLKVESVEVMVSSRGFDQNNDAGGNSENNQRNNRKVRKSLLEELENLDETVPDEENLKEALGNTVSYTA